MAKDYSRVKRGMVFTYNINPDVDKFNPPAVTVRGKEYKDHLQYGWRTYVVVSNDIGNAYSPTCNIVPMTSQQDKSDIPTHVPIVYEGQKLQILCEQVYTVNTMELTRYECILTPETMKLVDKALAVQLGIPNYSYDPNVKLSLDKIEDIINGIISQRVAELSKPQVADAVDIEDAVLRIGEGLMTLFDKKDIPDMKEAPITADIKVDDTIASVELEIAHEDINKNMRSYKPQSQIEKFYNKYPSERPKKSTTHSKPRKWTPEIMRQFVDDSKILPPTEMVKKYEFSDVNSYYKSKWYVTNKLEGVSKNDR